MRMKPLEIIEKITRSFIEKLGNAVENFEIYNIVDYPHPVQYWGGSVKFKIYNFYAIVISLECEKLWIYIPNLHDGGDIKISNNNCSTMDWDKLVEEVKEEVQLRIPDKYLIAKGYK